jgi:hypothetical protein
VVAFGQWQALQSLCDELVQHPNILWAGITEADRGPQWLCFSGPDEPVPLEQGPDQNLRPIAGDDPPGAGLLELWPPLPSRSWLCAYVLPADVLLIVVPRAVRDRADREPTDLVRDSLRRMCDLLPGGEMPPEGSPPRQPPPLTPLHKWAWLPLPGRVPRK